MNMARKLMWGAALLALAACGRGPEPEGRDMTAEEVAGELAAVQIEPGLWEATSEVINVSAPNLPREVMTQMVGRETSVRNCITPEQAARPDANFLTAQEGSNCTYSDFSMRNGRLQGVMTCSGGGLPGEMRTTMNGQYGPRSYDITMRMETSGMPQGADMTIEARTTGRRVGACPEDGAGG
jgi:hypothetical protein